MPSEGVVERVTPERVLLRDGRVFPRPGGAAYRPGQRVIVDCRPGLTGQTPMQLPRSSPVMDTPFIPLRPVKLHSLNPPVAGQVWRFGAGGGAFPEAAAALAAVYSGHPVLPYEDPTQPKHVYPLGVIRTVDDVTEISVAIATWGGGAFEPLNASGPPILIVSKRDLSQAGKYHSHYPQPVESQAYVLDLPFGEYAQGPFCGPGYAWPPDPNYNRPDCAPRFVAGAYFPGRIRLIGYYHTGDPDAPGDGTRSYLVDITVTITGLEYSVHRVGIPGDLYPGSQKSGEIGGNMVWITPDGTGFNVWDGSTVTNTPLPVGPYQYNATYGHGAPDNNANFNMLLSVNPVVMNMWNLTWDVPVSNIRGVFEMRPDGSLLKRSDELQYPGWDVLPGQKVLIPRRTQQSVVVRPGKIIPINLGWRYPIEDGSELRDEDQVAGVRIIGAEQRFVDLDHELKKVRAGDVLPVKPQMHRTVENTPYAPYALPVPDPDRYPATQIIPSISGEGEILRELKPVELNVDNRDLRTPRLRLKAGEEVLLKWPEFDDPDAFFDLVVVGRVRRGKATTVYLAPSHDDPLGSARFSFTSNPYYWSGLDFPEKGWVQFRSRFSVLRRVGWQTLYVHSDDEVTVEFSVICAEKFG